MSDIWKVLISSQNDLIYEIDAKSAHGEPYIEYNSGGIRKLYILKDMAILWNAELIRNDSLKMMTIKLPGSDINKFAVYDEMGRLRYHFQGHIVPATDRTMGEIPEPGVGYMPDIRWYYTAVHRATVSWDGTNTVVRFPKLPEVIVPNVGNEPKFKLTEPTDFGTGLSNINKFFYFFGIDEIEILNKKINKTCGFITREVDIEPNTKIELTSEYYDNNTSSIEFYIIDNNQEIPIKPIELEKIEDEKIFFNKNTRFDIDTSKEIIIKKNGIKSSMSFEQVKSISDGSLYTISYYPVSQAPYTVKGNSIKIKTILRVYDEERKPPYIKSIGIKKYRLEGFEWQR